MRQPVVARMSLGQVDAGIALELPGGKDVLVEGCVGAFLRLMLEGKQIEDTGVYQAPAALEFEADGRVALTTAGGRELVADVSKYVRQADMAACYAQMDREAALEAANERVMDRGSA